MKMKRKNEAIRDATRIGEKGIVFYVTFCTDTNRTFFLCASIDTFDYHTSTYILSFFLSFPLNILKENSEFYYITLF